jgi:hypothetical protein
MWNCNVNWSKAKLYICIWDDLSKCGMWSHVKREGSTFLQIYLHIEGRNEAKFWKFLQLGIYIRIWNDIDCLKSEWRWLNFYIFHSENLRFDNRVVQSCRELEIMHYYSLHVEIIVRPPTSALVSSPYIFFIRTMNYRSVIWHCNFPA